MALANYVTCEFSDVFCHWLEGWEYLLFTKVKVAWNTVNFVEPVYTFGKKNARGPNMFTYMLIWEPFFPIPVFLSDIAHFKVCYVRRKVLQGHILNEL